MQAITVEIGWLKRVIFSREDSAQIDSAREQGNCLARIKTLSSLGDYKLHYLVNNKRLNEIPKKKLIELLNTDTILEVCSRCENKRLEYEIISEYLK